MKKSKESIESKLFLTVKTLVLSSNLTTFPKSGRIGAPSSVEEMVRLLIGQFLLGLENNLSMLSIVKSSVLPITKSISIGSC